MAGVWGVGICWRPFTNGCEVLPCLLDPGVVRAGLRGAEKGRGAAILLADFHSCSLDSQLSLFIDFMHEKPIPSASFLTPKHRGIPVTEELWSSELQNDLSGLKVLF